MYKLYIDETAYSQLRLWAEENRNLVKGAKPYFNKAAIYFKYKKIANIVLIAEKTKVGYKYSLLDESSPAEKLVAKGNIIPDCTGDNDFNLSVKINNMPHFMHEAILDDIKRHATALIHANAFMWYGNITDHKELIAQGKNDKHNKIIVFKEFNDSLYAVPTSYHRSPEGVFEVRGHFRHYEKTGKVIWIDSYLKGVDKNGV